ncbi:MAG TPA: metalloregulator ArsR/SmtB family transcription factor [Gemmatimonadaceae bacterium]|nr:metalloregulator ArsR/SmtB family transcription factor [Gemmatimonadaceae bacterium]
MTIATKVDAARAAHLFHALSDPIRIDVVTLLAHGERCVCELMEALDLAQSKLSWHLKTLSDAGVIIGRRDGRWNYYSLDAATLAETSDILGALKPSRRLAVRTVCCD